MNQHAWDSTSDQVAAIGQGTWLIEQAERGAAIRALRGGLDLGMNHIDTAEMYGDGEAERIVGEAIAGRRDEVFLVSKVLPQNASRAGTRSACERSLARLKTDRLDCYLLHWRGRYPLEETVAGFDDLRRAGLIRSWGVSNFDVQDLEELRTLASGAECACNQLLYHLEERAIEHAVLPWCERHRVTVTAYSPFGHGRFPSPRSPRGRLLAQIAAAHGATPRQVALAFLTRRPAVVAIPKASTIAHAEENAAAGYLQLSESEIRSIDATFPPGAPPAVLPTL
jgi:diketogulonate reductase-like aldo/keto reductase